jgi:tetratricopeptide (TPR) repeat protein
MRALLRPLAIAAVALGAAAWLNLDHAARSLARPFDVAYVPRGGAMRIAALGHRTLLSDLYWLQLVQYVGDAQAAARGWDKVYPLADLVTDLDPRHGYAYQTAGIVLSSAGRLEESDRILDKGMEKGPPYWTFPYYRAFNAWFYRGDYQRGAYWAREAAKRPGASPNISQLAVSLSSKSGTPDDAIAMIDEVLATVKDEVSLSRLVEQRNLAVLERDAQALERAVERFRAAHGRDPSSLHELVVTGLVPALPKDPFGGEYRWLPDERKVRSSANPFRFQIREGPQPPGGFVPPEQAETARRKALE